MIARELHVDTMAGGEIILRLPEEIRGWRAVGVAEVTQDNGAHQAFALILESPSKAQRVALWWQRDPVRRWAITPL